MGIRANAKSSLITHVSLIFLVLLVTNPRAFAQAFDPAHILSHPSSYDGKRLTVSGTLKNALAETTREGKDYTTFDLCNDTCMKVFLWGRPKLREGQRQSVSGTFETRKHVGPYTLENVLETHEGSIR
jgi:hypothetical protein